MIVNEISLMIQNIKPKEDYKIMLLEIFLLVGSSSWLLCQRIEIEKWIIKLLIPKVKQIMKENSWWWKGEQKVTSLKLRPSPSLGSSFLSRGLAPRESNVYARWFNTSFGKKGKVLRVLPSGRWLPRNQGWLNFWESKLVTVRKSLHRSCWTELTCQGILLP